MLIFKGHRSPVRELTFSPDGTALASIAGRGYAISLWEVSSGEGRAYLSNRTRQSVNGIAFLPDGSTIISCSRWSTMTRWDLSTSLPQPEQKYGAPSGYYDRLVVSSDGQRCTVIVEPFYLYGETYAYHHDLKDCHNSVSFRLNCRNVRQDGCLSTSLSPDDTLLAVALQVDRSTEIRVAYLNVSGNRVANLGAGRSVAFSPNGELLAVAVDHRIELRQTRTWEVLASLSGHTKEVNHLAFSPDGEKLLSGGQDHTVRMWDVASQSEEQHFDWDIGRVSRVTFAPDGMRAAAGGQGQIVIWDVD